MSLTIKIEVNGAYPITGTSQSLLVDLNFKTAPLGFNMVDFSVMSLTCSTIDATWNMPRPKIWNPQIPNVKITMLTESKLFTFDADTQIVFLSGT